MDVTREEIIKRIEQELSKASWTMDLSTHGDFSATIFGIKVLRSNPRSDDCDQVSIESAHNPRIVMTMWEDERRLGYPENDVVSAARDAVLEDKERLLDDEIISRAQTCDDLENMTKFTSEMSREEIFLKIAGTFPQGDFL